MGRTVLVSLDGLSPTGGHGDENGGQYSSLEDPDDPDIPVPLVRGRPLLPHVTRLAAVSDSTQLRFSSSASMTRMPLGPRT